MNYSIILAGGIGSRFWPLSTDKKPKQFLSLYSNQPLLLESVKRISPLTKKKNIYIATNKIYKNMTFDCLNKLNIPKRNFFFEPEGKNTFAPISGLAGMIFAQDKEAVIAVFPSDHFIKNKNEFLKVLKKAFVLASSGCIVVLGITPKGPETGFGYVKIKGSGRDGYLVDKFIEKPDFNSARKLLKSKNCYWNGGIFVFQAKALLEEIKRLQPKVYKMVSKTRDKEGLIKSWSEFPSISIDYSIMEKARNLKLLPLDCGWSDLGSWRAVEEARIKDKNGNIFISNTIDLGSKNTLVYSDSRCVATLGLKDIIIVDTKDALLVCSKEKAQEVKKVVELLKLKNVKLK